MLSAKFFKRSYKMIRIDVFIISSLYSGLFASHHLEILENKYYVSKKKCNTMFGK